MMATESVGTVLRDLKSRVGGIATALVARNGVVLSADLPEGVFAETFSVMCATILGAATTASRELSRTDPQRVVFEGPDSTTLIVGAGETALLVVVVDRTADSARVVSEVAKFVDLVSNPPRGRTT